MIELIIIVCIIAYVLVNCLVKDDDRRQETNDVLLKILKYTCFTVLGIFVLLFLLGFFASFPVLSLFLIIGALLWINKIKIKWKD